VAKHGVAACDLSVHMLVTTAVPTYSVRRLRVLHKWKPCLELIHDQTV